MNQSLKKGKAIELDSIDTIADGLSAPFIGEKNFEIAQKYLDELITVSDQEIISTMWLIYERTKLFIEPSSAASLAPIIHNKYKLPKNSNPIFIMCGGNIDNISNLESIKWGHIKIHKKYSSLIKFFGIYYIYGVITKK